MDTSFTICTHAVDVPSLGSLLYQTLCGEPGTYAGTGSARYELDFVCTLLCCCFFFSPRKRILHRFQEQLLSLGSLLSNDVARNTSPMKVGAGVGIAKGCCVGAGLWRRQSSL